VGSTGSNGVTPSAITSHSPYGRHVSSVLGGRDSFLCIVECAGGRVASAFMSVLGSPTSSGMYKLGDQVAL